MKKAYSIILYFIFILQQNYNLSQWNNLFPNYSFENTDITSWINSGLANTTLGLQDGRFTDNSDSFPSKSVYEQIIQYWSYCDYWTVPDRRYFWCGQGIGGDEDPIGTPDITYEPLTVNGDSNDEFQRYYSGNICAYTGTGGGGEFVVVQPESTIQNGHYYYIEVFVGTDSDHSGQVGKIDLFTQKPHVCSINEPFITNYGGNGPSQNALTCNISFTSDDSLGWQRYRGYFRAVGDYSWISVGSPDELYWDDLKIIEVDQMMCREDWYFDNTVFNYPIEIFQAGDKIVAGTGADTEEAEQLHGPVTVLAGSHTRFTAGNSIELLPGFSVESGAIFETDTVPCQQLCVPIIFPDLQFDCISSPTSIGIDGYEGTYTTLSWSPSTYLDDADSINPTFTPPPGQSGSITYIVSYTNSCPLGSGVFPPNLQYQVTVNYIDAALVSVSPTISYSNLTYTDELLEVDLSINSATNEIEINAYDGNGMLTYSQILIRGVDYYSNALSLSFGNDFNLHWSKCMDYHFEITAKNTCAEDDDLVEFNWIKTSHDLVLGTLPNLITPDGDNINDEYCFTIDFVDSYSFKIVNDWGVTVFSTFVFPVTDSNQCPWDGLDNDGDELNDGHYNIIVNAINSCGDEIDESASVWILGGSKSPLNEDEYLSDERLPVEELDAIVTTNNSSINVLTSINEPLQIIITDNLGRIILENNFSGTFTYGLASGIYNVFISSESGLSLRRKIIVV